MKLLRMAVAIGLLAGIGALATAGRVHAGASPTLLLQSTAHSGGVGSSMTFKYSWDYGDCNNNAKDLASLAIVLTWDDAAQTVIGSGPVTVMKGPPGQEGAGQCGGTATGSVPASTTGGDHFPSAHLKDSAESMVPNSSAQVPQGQQFTVTGVATPTPTPAPPTAPPATNPPGTSATAQPTSSGGGNTVVPVTPTGGPLPPPSGRLPLIILAIIAVVLGGSLAFVLRRQQA
jgi:hypothetical protein